MRDSYIDPDAPGISGYQSPVPSRLTGKALAAERAEMAAARDARAFDWLMADPFRTGDYSQNLPVRGWNAPVPAPGPLYVNGKVVPVERRGMPGNPASSGAARTRASRKATKAAEAAERAARLAEESRIGREAMAAREASERLARMTAAMAAVRTDYRDA